jgi:NADPH-dependent 2,4-dienoyl-CoA reductase/sulfur reductase-like enzyme
MNIKRDVAQSIAKVIQKRGIDALIANSKNKEKVVIYADLLRQIPAKDRDKLFGWDWDKDSKLSALILENLEESEIEKFKKTEAGDIDTISAKVLLNALNSKSMDELLIKLKMTPQDFEY